MKLEKKIIDFIKRAVKTTAAVKINSIIIERDRIRAMSDEKTIILLHRFDEDEIELPFDALAIHRIDVFLQRLSVVETLPMLSVDATVIEDKTTNLFVVSELKMKATGIKIDFRCASLKTVLAPKQISDTMKFEVELLSNAVPLLGKGISAMDCNDTSFVTVLSNDQGVMFELTDSNNDVFSHVASSKAVNIIDGGSALFAFKYPAKLLYQLLNQNPEGRFSVGIKGMLEFVVNGMNVYVLPQL